MNVEEKKNQDKNDVITETSSDKILDVSDPIKPKISITSKHAPIRGTKKESRCRIVLLNDSRIKTINGKVMGEALHRSEFHIQNALLPLKIVEQDIGFKAVVTGGGFGSISSSIKHALAKAIANLFPVYRTSLKQAGLLKVDSRCVWQKISGQPKARKRRQHSKR